MRYRCLDCGEEFESKVGKGNRHCHMSTHGYSLKGALETGKATPLVDGKEDEVR